jgi:hypothetical protein
VPAQTTLRVAYEYTPADAPTERRRDSTILEVFSSDERVVVAALRRAFPDRLEIRVLRVD